MKVLYSDYEIVKLNMPYVPGFLAFREAAHILNLFTKLLHTKPEYFP